MKISNSKKELAKIISENGGWRGGSFSAQDQSASVTFFMTLPWRNISVWESDEFEYIDGFIPCARTLPNWHQTILSRAEYFHLYPEYTETEYKDGVKPTDPAKVECPSKPSIESLATDYRNKLDHADRKQDEADKANIDADAALSELERAIAAIGFTITPIGAVAQEAELVITDWRDLRVGDIVEIAGSENERWLIFKGVELFVSRTGTAECSLAFSSHDGDEWGHGGNTNWRFIRRPAK